MGLDQYLEGVAGRTWTWGKPRTELGYWRKAPELDAYICSNFPCEEPGDDWNFDCRVRLTAADLEKLIDVVLDDPALVFPPSEDGSTRWRRVNALQALSRAVSWLEEDPGENRTVFYRNDI